MTHYILGVDGGGTRTRAAIVTENGRFCGLGVAGPSNYDDVGVAQAQANIAAAIAQAREKAGLAPRPFAAAFLGMAGVVSDADRHIIRQIARSLNLAPAERVGVHHDIHIALAGGLMGEPGIALIAGTGSSCYGRNAGGQEWRAGGWGHLLADEGSGYWLGLSAMRCAVNAHDGRGQPTALLETIVNALELTHINDIMHRLYSRGMSRAEIAALAPQVIETAQNGDQVANNLLDQAARDLAQCVVAVARRLDMTAACNLILIGGLMEIEEEVVRPLTALLREQLPACHIRQPILPPVLGACLLGLTSLKQTIPPSTAAALREGTQTV